MDGFRDSSNDSEILNENSLPVELQTQNIVNPAFAMSSTNAHNGQINTHPAVKQIAPTQKQPYVVISEQPQQRGFRFRYECEGPSHGGLQGTKSEKSRKSYPSIKIENYSGAARITVQLVTDEKTPRSHAHKLVGSNCDNGVCTMEIKANSEPISFQNLCILHVTRKKLVDVLTERILDTIKLDRKLKANDMNWEPPINAEDRRSAKHQAQEQSKTMQLNVVRLCFQVFLRNSDGSLSKMLTPVVSQPIYDSKSPGASALKICRMDRYGGCCTGNDEVFLLCEKVQKDDIKVRFMEQNPDGSVKWQAYGNFGPLDVHRQYAIVFKTPAYWDTNIETAVNVLIMLQRNSDSEVSEPLAFTYFPQNRDKDNIARKKRKRIPLDGYGFGGDGDFGGSFGGGGGNGGDVNDNDANGGNNGTTNNNFLMIPNGGGHTQNRTLPAPVEEVIGQFSTKPMLQSEKLARQIASPMSTTNDPWVGGSDSDVDVDSDIQLPPSPFTKATYQEWPKAHYTPHINSPIDSHGNFKSFDEVDGLKEHNVVKSLVSMDSGVDPGFSKSFSIGEEGKEHQVVSEAQKRDKEPLQDLKNKNGLEIKEREQKKTTKALSVSDYHSEEDHHITSEGLKSDEGFSDTSEELALRLQHKPPGGNPNAKPVSSHSKEVKITATKLSNTARQVAEMVAEKTVAALTDFAETGDIRHLLLVQRHLMTVSNDNGDLPLHLAVINSQPDAVKSLLDVMSTVSEAKSQINAFNLLRQTPLHLASIMQLQSIVEMLLHAGANPTIGDRNGNTAAHLAVMNKSRDCLKSLVKYVRPGMTKSFPFPELNYLNYEGFSPVHLAAQTGDVEMLKTLVFGKADVDLVDGKSGKTALHHAVDNDDISVVGYLLNEANCDVNARCFDGNTALHIACARQFVGMVASLINAGADVELENEEIPDTEPGEEASQRDRCGLTPIDYVGSNTQILRLLQNDFEGMGSLMSGSQTSEELSSQMSTLYLEKSSLSQPESLSGDFKSSFSSSTASEFTFVSTKTRIEMTRMLDPSSNGRDVYALAEKLGYTSQLNVLKSIEDTGHSPTTLLLEYFETDEGNIHDLKEGLHAIDRDDVASLIM